MSNKLFEANLTKSDISFGQVIIKSPELLEALVKDQDEVLKSFEEQISPLDLDKIAVDEYGRIIIDDEKIREALQKIVQDETAGGLNVGNCGCNER